ncbi:MAG: hypothetical protein ACE5F4_02795, partial [Candidatus Paceibacteria bacterium]
MDAVHTTVSLFAPMNVPVYRVSLEGKTVTEPFDTGLALPALLLIEPLAAFDDVQDKVALSPLATLAGVTESVHAGPVGGGGGGGGGSTGRTPTVAVHVAVSPDGFVTVPVNVVVVVSAPVETEPPTLGVTAPMPWSIENDAPAVVVQESVALSPLVTEAGDRESVQVGAPGGGGGGGGGTVMLASHIAVPPGPS